MFIKFLSFIKLQKYFLIYSLATPIVCIGFIWAARHVHGLGQWYASTVFPIFPNTLGRLFSPIPFSVLEIGLYTAAISLVFLLLFTIESLFTKTGRNKLIARIPRAFVLTLCVASTIFLMLSLTCSINYSRDGIAQDLNMSISPSSHEDLVSLCLLLINDLTVSATELEEFSEINPEVLDTRSLHKETKAAMKKLGQKYPSLNGYYPNPKPVIMSSWMSDMNLTGLFAPYTIEANYNDDVVFYIQPYTIAHELAHLKGYIREDEAGFIAYLACSNADSQVLRYSGSLNALSYALNALYKDASSEEYQEILQLIPESVFEDLIENQEYWQNHRGTVAKLSSAANDQYLKANAQADGVKSYGRMVDLLLAYYGFGRQAV